MNIKLKKNLFYSLFFVLILIFGIFIRIKLFIYNPSLFKDEANLARNIIDRDYINLFNPLNRLQVAPLFFLILSKFIYGLFNVENNPYLSDLVLRIVPLMSGIISIPLFGLLCFKIFRHRMFSCIGALILSCTPLAITFSVNYKQYSTEMLVAILALLITLSINIKKDSYLKNVLKFISIGMLPYLSLSVLLILPFCFLYLLHKSIVNKNVKQYLFYSLFSFYVFGFYYFIFIKGIISAHYNDMVAFWSLSRIGSDSYSKIAKYALLGIFISLVYRKIRILYLCLMPTIAGYYLCMNFLYPAKDRLLLFMIPIWIILLLCALKIVPAKKYKKLENFYKIPSLLFVICIIIYFSNINCEDFRYRKEFGREIWEQVMQNIEPDSNIIIGRSPNTNIYYSNLYKNIKIKYFNLEITHKLQQITTFPPGEYYFVSSASDDKYIEHVITFIKKRYIIEEQESYKNAFYIKFIK